MVQIDIDHYFDKINQLQNEVFTKIRELIEIDQDSEESIELRRTELSKKANKFITEINSVLQIIQIKYIESDQDYSDENLHKIKYEIYKEKYNGLKKTLRDCQLKSYNFESEIIHKQRIQKLVQPYLVKEKGSDKNGDNELGDKQDLFAGRTINKAEKKQSSSIQDQILSQNKNITNSLQLTRQLMSTSIMQTELNIDSIDQQSKDLHKLNENLMDLNVILNKSRQIVKFIEKQDKESKQKIYLSIGFLLLCCMWVIWKRILRIPVKIMLWTFFKVFGIFSWFNVKSKFDQPQQMKVYATAYTTEPISSTVLSTSTLGYTSDIPRMSTLVIDEDDLIDLEKEYTQVIGEKSHDTWDEIIQQTAERIIDEL